MISSMKMKGVNVITAADKKSSTLEFKEYDIPTLKEGEVLLKVKATAVNRVDLLQRRGAYPVPEGASHILGLEAVGEIVDNDLKLQGNALIGALVSGGSYAEYVAVQKSHTFELPAGYDLVKAASIPEIWLTAHALARQMANVKQGESVYVNAGASAVGNALIQICSKTYGCNVYASASTPDKIEECKKYGAFDGIAYKGATEEEMLEKPLKALEAKAKGYDIAFDCVGQSQEAMISKLLGVDSRWILYGLLSGPTLKESSLLGNILRKRISLRGFTLRNQPKSFKTELVNGFKEEILPKLLDGKYQIVVDCSVKVDFNKPEDVLKIEECHEKMTKSQNVGKIVIVFE